MEKGYDLWMTNPRTRETKLIAKLDGGPAGLDVSKDGKSIFVVSDGKIMKVDAESGRPLSGSCKRRNGIESK
jgi:hypothetical protein